MLPIEIVYTVTKTNDKTGHAETYTYTINEDDITRLLIKEHAARKNRVTIQPNDEICIIDLI